MRCPYCQEQNDEDSDFCMSCGQRLPLTQIERFCSQCGAEHLTDASFCSNCGAAFGGDAPKSLSKAAEETPTSVRQLATPIRPASGIGLKIAIGFVAGCLVLLVGALGIGFWLHARAPVPATTTADALLAQRDQAFHQFAQGMELMEALERGRGDESALVNALEHAEQATLLDPSVAVYWHLLGHIYSKMPEDQMASVMAEDALTKAVSLNTENVSSRLLLARLLIGRESYDQALDQLEWLGRKDPQLLNTALIADMCRAYVVDEQAARGEAFLRDMRRQRPQLSALRLGLAILLHEQGQKPAALEELQELLAGGQAYPEDVAYAQKLQQVWRGGQP